MPARRILSLWFPRLGAERLLRQMRGLAMGPFVTVRDQQGAQVLASLSVEAEAGGLSAGQSLRDARALCSGLVVRPGNPLAEAAFLTGLRRWAGKFTPWVGEEAPDALVLDITGCAHLFGGEQGVLAQIEGDCAGLGLSLRMGLADTVGAAWALARFAGAGVMGGPGGDAIQDEARATRSRARPRHLAGGKGGNGGGWGRGGGAPSGVTIGQAPATRIAAPGACRAAVAPLPIAALRLPDDSLAGLARLGLRRVEDVLAMPRAGLARRFGRDLVLRLDQALGMVPEPVSPARPPLHFAVRMRLPDPIGLEADLLAGIDRLLPELCARLAARGRGAREVRLELGRVDGTMQAVRARLARPARVPARIRPLLAMQLGEVEAGFGIDQMRLVASAHEAQAPRQHQGPMRGRAGTGAGAGAGTGARAGTGAGGEAENVAGSATRSGAGSAAGSATGSAAEGEALADLIGRIGARLGLEAITRLAPAESHIPEKAAQILAAAWSEPARTWQPPPVPRPLLLWPPEPVMQPGRPDSPAPPTDFRWRGQVHRLAAARGPERIAPEWWLTEDVWRSGPRDYWQVVTGAGARLWLYYAHGAELSPGWFCHGSFA